MGYLIEIFKKRNKTRENNYMFILFRLNKEIRKLIFKKWNSLINKSERAKYVKSFGYSMTPLKQLNFVIKINKASLAKNDTINIFYLDASNVKYINNKKIGYSKMRHYGQYNILPGLPIMYKNKQDVNRLLDLLEYESRESYEKYRLK